MEGEVVDLSTQAVYRPAEFIDLTAQPFAPAHPLVGGSVGPRSGFADMETPTMRSLLKKYQPRVAPETHILFNTITN